MNRVDYGSCLREEVFFKLISGGYPVAGTEGNCRSIKIIECKFVNVGSHVFHYRVAFASVTDDNDFTGLLNRFNYFFVVEGNYRAGVDNFGFNAVFLFQGLCGFIAR